MAGMFRHLLGIEGDQNQAFASILTTSLSAIALTSTVQREPSVKTCE